MVPLYISENDSTFAGEWVNGPVAVTKEFYRKIEKEGIAELQTIPDPRVKTGCLEVIMNPGWYDDIEHDYPVYNIDDIWFHLVSIHFVLNELGFNMPEIKSLLIRHRQDPLAMKLRTFFESEIEPKTVTNAWMFVLDDPFFDEGPTEILFTGFDGKPRRVNRNSFAARLRRLKKSE